jgi:F-type H+-transporting ATPase subunit b
VKLSIQVLDIINAWIAVLILFWFLRRYAFPPLLKAIQDRQGRIQADLDAAKAQRDQAEALKGELEQELRDVRQKAEAALTRALRDAEGEASQILERARTEARRLVEDAQGEIQAERERALNAVKDQVAGLAMEVAERVLSRRLDQEDDKRLFEQFLKDLETTPS